MITTNLSIAQEFAQFLDQNDFKKVVLLLHPDCKYECRGELLEGAQAIIKTYKENYENALPKLDEVVFTSSVEELSPTEFKINFIDKIRKADQWSEFRCHQLIHFSNNQITHIVHKEDVAEHKAIREFIDGKNN